MSVSGEGCEHCNFKGWIVSSPLCMVPCPKCSPYFKEQVQPTYAELEQQVAALTAENERLTRERDEMGRELDSLRSGARTGLLRFMMAGDVGCFADRMRNLLQSDNLDELRNCVKDFFNAAKDKTERGYEEITREAKRAEQAESDNERLRGALQRIAKVTESHIPVTQDWESTCEATLALEIQAIAREALNVKEDK